MKMTRDELLKKLLALVAETGTDFKKRHEEADYLLVTYIDDREIADAFAEIGKWYS